MVPDGLDELDRRILDIIRENARLTYKEIGEKAGISRISAKNRMSAMEEKGIIRGYRTVTDEEKAEPRGVRFFLELVTDPEQYDAAAEYLSGDERIIRIYGMTGESRLLAEGLAPNSATMDVFTRSLYRALKGLRRVSCSAVLATLMDRKGGVGYVRCEESEDLEK